MLRRFKSSAKYRPFMRTDSLGLAERIYLTIAETLEPSLKSTTGQKHKTWRSNNNLSLYVPEVLITENECFHLNIEDCKAFSMNIYMKEVFSN